MIPTRSVLAAGAALFFAATAVSADEVRVYNWSDYIDESLLEKFQQETGIKLIYDVFDSNEVLETKLLSGATGYDVVVPSASFLERQIQAGVFRKLDRSQLPNISNSWDLIDARTALFDPGNAHAVTYMWGTTGIGYNVDKVKQVLGEDAPVNSLQLIFEPKYLEKLKSCGVHILDAPTELIPAALQYIGEDPNSHDPKVIAKSEAVLAKMRPYVTKFHSSEYVNGLANGDICVALGWSGDVLQARARAEEAGAGVKIAYQVPKEGAQMWFDLMAIPADAPNPDAAHKFINFMLDAQNAALASNYVFYANGNKASQSHIDPALLGDPAVYPDAATLNNLYTVSAYPRKAQRSVTRLWTKIKSGR